VIVHWLFSIPADGSTALLRGFELMDAFITWVFPLSFVFFGGLVVISEFGAFINEWIDSRRWK